MKQNNRPFRESGSDMERDEASDRFAVASGSLSAAAGELGLSVFRVGESWILIQVCWTSRVLPV